MREVTQLLLNKGCYEVSLGDTIGVGTPGAIANVLKNVLETVRPGQVALHLHDTYGQALANILVGLQHGITTFDASVAGLGKTFKDENVALLKIFQANKIDQSRFPIMG